MTDTRQDDVDLRLAEFTGLLTTAIDNADAREAIQRLADEQAALRRVAMLVAREASQAEVFGAIAEEIGRLIDAEAIRVLRYERDSTAQVVASWGVDGDIFPRVGFRAKLGGDNATSHVFFTGQPVRIDNYAEASGPIGEAVKAASRLRSSVATPIVVEGRPWGVVIAGTSSFEPMAPDTESRLTQFSDLVATAIANAQSREALADLAEEQAALRRVATLAARELAPVEVLVAVTEEAARVLKTDAVAMLRFEHGGAATLVAQSQTPWDPPPLGTRFTLEGENVVASVHRTGLTARMDDWTNATGSVAAMAHVLGVSSAVATPIIVEGRLWGTMVAATNQSTPLPADIESRIGEFTELVATAIANAESREALAELAGEQAALRRAATLVARGLPPNAIFAAVSEEVARVFDSAAGVLRFEDGSAVVFVGVANIDIPIGTRWEFQEGMTSAEVYRTGRPARVEEVDWSSLGGPVGEASRRLGTLSIVGSPILVEGRLWGAMIVSSPHDLLPLDTEERLEKFTELIATAIANAETRRARAQLAEEQAALRRVATLVAEGASPTEVFDAVTAEVGRALPADAATLSRYEPDGTFTMVGGWGREDGSFPWARGERPERAPLEAGTAMRLVFETRRPGRIDSYQGVSGPVGGLARERGWRSVGAPVIVEGRLWGVMVVVTSDRSLPLDTEERLTGFTELVATAIANAENRYQLAASRKRLVAASDEARRRIERDLHDGTQQRLVSLALAARAAAAALPTQSRDVREKFSNIATGLGEAVEELQELSRGIHPAILSDAGLGPALEALALRSPIPVELTVMTQRRFPEPVEVAAYFVASESLANAAKHSQSSRIDVALTMENERLLLSVCDDGIGGADPGRGSGLVGLRDRVDALGGSLEITSNPGGGTSLAATLPIRDELGHDTDSGP